MFTSYPWPGNVRELRNIIERLIIMAPGPMITAAVVPPPINAPVNRATQEDVRPFPTLSGRQTLKDARADFEREFITRKLRENNGNVSKTADLLSVERSNLHRKIKSLGIELED